MPRIAACGDPVLVLEPACGGAHAAPTGCSRIRGWPGETRSPSSTSHSTTSPPWAAVTVTLSRVLATSPISSPAVEHVGVGGRLGHRERALRGGDHHPPGRSGVDDRALTVLLAERAGVVELVGSLQRERLDTLQRALGDAGQGAGRRHLEDAGDTEVAHRVQAQVPAHRAGDLADDPAQHLATLVEHVAVAVGDHRDARVVDRHRHREPRDVGDRGSHVVGVERAGHAERHQPDLGRRVSRRARRAARACRRRRSGRGRCRWPASVRARTSEARTSSRSPPRIAVMPVGVTAEAARPSRCRAPGPGPSPARR